MFRDLWDSLLVWFPLLLAAGDVVLATGATIHLLLRKRESRTTIAWAGLIWLAPYLGTVAYLLLGINRIVRKAHRIGLRQARAREATPIVDACKVCDDAQVVHTHPTLVGLARLVGRVTERELLPGNRIVPLANGDEAYPEMLSAIDHAEHSICLLSYIFDFDRAGEQFYEALTRAHLRGVQVRVLVDDVGSRYSSRNIVTMLQQAGVPATTFLPTRRLWLLTYANLRNHRKILVVDGRVGFTGGTNIREGHCLEWDPAAPVQCLHFRVEGPVVAQLQEAFVIDWSFAQGESLQGPLWFPPLNNCGMASARGITDGPDEDLDKMQDTLLGALASARESVHIVTPYFLPESSLIDMLTTTAMRGVEVRILLPAENNIPLVHWAMLAELPQLLKKDCQIFFSPPPFDHTKLLVIDRLWSLIGSTNWDPRSLRLNFEFNIECYDAELAEYLARHVDERIALAHRVTLQELESRRITLRLRDSLARLLSPYL